CRKSRNRWATNSRARCAIAWRPIVAKLSGLYRPSTLPEALSLLAEDADAKPISGGATLVAMMNAHVIEPNALVSLAGIEELRGISEQPDGTIRIGAFTRHRETAADARLK